MVPARRPKPLEHIFTFGKTVCSKRMKMISVIFAVFFGLTILAAAYLIFTGQLSRLLGA
jgi:hypothetical protein